MWPSVDINAQSEAEGNDIDRGSEQTLNTNQSFLSPCRSTEKNFFWPCVGVWGWGFWGECECKPV